MAREPITGRTLGERIACALMRAGFVNPKTGGLDKQAVARAVGVRWGTVQDWILETYRPKRDNVTRLAEVTGVTPDELLGTATGQNPPFPAWFEFLETPAGKSLTPSQRIAMQSFAWPDDEEPDLASYHMLYAVLLAPRKRRRDADAAE